MTVKFGIVGLGNIAHQVARAIQEVPEASLIAVGSRTQNKADAFAAEFNVPVAYGNYDKVFHHPDVDCIYIATPHCCHYQDAMASLRAGKHVLCEKPFMLNEAQAADVIALAREQGLFCMEAMWTRFFPLMERVRELVSDGTIGEVRALHADFSFRAECDPQSRLFDPCLAGGALLDVGIYPLSLASMIFGRPTTISGIAHMGTTGVDEQNAMTLGYSNGEQAILTSAIRTAGFQDAQIIGTRGRIRIHPKWFVPSAMTVYREGKADELLEIPFAGNGYSFEVKEVVRCISSGLTESPLMPLDETLSNARIMTTLRKSWQLLYPGEKPNISKPEKA